MAARGKFIAIEGVDGAGKRTQCELLNQALQTRGIPCAPFAFPRYESTFGRLIAAFLNGDLGRPEAIDAHLSALLYAGDRLEAKPELTAALAEGKTILADRYIASNLAHQAARVAPAQQAEFLSWVRHLEYDIYGLPAEDVLIYLRLLPTEAQRLVGKKPSRNYTPLQRDLLEADLHHLERASEVYDVLARDDARWITVECFDAAAGILRTPEDIHREVLESVESRVFSRTAAK